MSEKPTLDDLIGIEYAKLGFFREVQEKVAELQASNLKLELKRRHIQGILDGITDVMAILTLDFRITSVNHVYYAISLRKRSLLENIVSRSSGSRRSDVPPAPWSSRSTRTAYADSSIFSP
jgi:PAS domain-containing protein